MSIDGTRSGSNQFMMDGAPNMQGTQVAYAPPPGVVDEFKVQGATFDATSGFMGGAAINMSLKSGANNLHGQVYYFMQNPVLNADKFFRLAAGKWTRMPTLQVGNYIYQTQATGFGDWALVRVKSSGGSSSGGGVNVGLLSAGIAVLVLAGVIAAVRRVRLPQVAR